MLVEGEWLKVRAFVEDEWWRWRLMIVADNWLDLMMLVILMTQLDADNNGTKQIDLTRVIYNGWTNRRQFQANFQRTSIAECLIGRKNWHFRSIGHIKGSEGFFSFCSSWDTWIRHEESAVLQHNIWINLYWNHLQNAQSLEDYCRTCDHNWTINFSCE